MENKDSYTPGEVREMFRAYREACHEHRNIMTLRETILRECSLLGRVGDETQISLADSYRFAEEKFRNALPENVLDLIKDLNPFEPK